MKVISFNFNKKLLYPLFFSFFFFIKQILSFNFWKVINGSSYTVLFSSVTLLYALIPYFISIKQKKSSIEGDNSTVPISSTTLASFLQIETKAPYNLSTHYSLILLCGVLSTLIQFIEAEMLKTYLWFNYYSCQSMLGIYVTVGFCYLIFDTLVYRHKILAMGIMLLITIVLGYFYVNTLLDMPIFDVNVIIISLILCLCDPIREVTEKYMMENHLMNSFALMSAEGIIGVIISITALLIAEFSKAKLDIFYIRDPMIIPVAFIDFIGQSWVNYARIGGLMLIIFLASHFRIKSNELFHPIQRYSFASIPYFLVSCAFSICCFLFRTMNDDVKLETGKVFLYYFGKIFNEKNTSEVTWQFVLDIVICYLWLFSAALMNEIIILFCCGLEKETKGRIGSRAIDEFNQCQGVFTELKDDEMSQENNNNNNMTLGIGNNSGISIQN